MNLFFFLIKFHNVCTEINLHQYFNKTNSNITTKQEKIMHRTQSGKNLNLIAIKVFAHLVIYEELLISKLMSLKLSLCKFFGSLIEEQFYKGPRLLI